MKYVFSVIYIFASFVFSLGMAHEFDRPPSGTSLILYMWCGLASLIFFILFIREIIEVKKK